MKTVNLNMFMGEPFFGNNRKNFKEPFENNKFVETKDFSRKTNAGFARVKSEFEDLVYEFKKRYFFKVAISKKKISSSLINPIIERKMKEVPIEKKYLNFDMVDPIEQTRLRNEYMYDLETDILKELDPVTEYVPVVYTTDGDANILAIGTKNKADTDAIISLLKNTFGNFGNIFHVGLDYDMTDMLKYLVTEDIRVDDLNIGTKIKLHDPDEKTSNITYKGFDILELEDIRNWIMEKGMSVTNIELDYKGITFVLDDKYMFTGVKPTIKMEIGKNEDGDATLHEFMAEDIMTISNILEVQKLLTDKY